GAGVRKVRFGVGARRTLAGERAGETVDHPRFSVALPVLPAIVSPSVRVPAAVGGSSHHVTTPPLCPAMRLPSWRVRRSPPHPTRSPHPGSRQDRIGGDLVRQSRSVHVRPRVLGAVRNDVRDATRSLLFG